MSHRNFRILVVEDDPAIRRGLGDALGLAGYEVLSASNGDEGLELGLGAELDLVLLDVVLPGKSGFEILPELRRCRPQLPIILVTARGAEDDRIFGLERGADDYVVKPFSAKELLARVRAVLRRSAERPLDVQQLRLAGLVIDFERREVTDGEHTPRALSERECEILRYLASNPGRAISRHELLEKVWGMRPSGVHTRTVDMHVARLREKLGDDPKEPHVVRTVRGKGYMIVLENGA